MTQDTAVRSVERALSILRSFEPARPRLAVGEMATALGVHASTASRLAATLARDGFLERGPGGDGFRLGPEMIRLGLLAAGGESLIEAARESMEELARETGETVVLSVPSGRKAVDVAQVDTRYLVGATSWVGRRLPLHATSDGKVLLAFGAAELEEEEALERVTPWTITGRAELEQELGEARANGWAPAVEECEPGLNGVAAPILATGRCIAALSVSGPAYRLPAEALPELGRRCREAAAAISSRR